ncbi:MAG: TonB-dependent receptor [Hyphomicrobiaceae bacterium]
MRRLNHYSSGMIGVSAIALAASSAPQPALAQTTLPGIVVTTPSPVVRAPRRRATPPPATQQPQSPATPVAEPPPLDDDLPGLLIVAEDAFVPVTVVPGREVLTNFGANLADSLDTKPGIIGSTFAPGASRPVIRGLDNYRVRIQENGIGTHDVSDLSEDHAVPIDPFSASRIEVVRGPATLRFGSQAIGGVVNASNNRIPDAIPRNGVSAEVQGGLTSVDDGRDGAMQVTAGAGNFAVHADAFRRSMSDYRTPDGVQPNSFVNAEGHAIGGSFVGRDGFIGLAFSRYASLYGIPGIEATEERSRIDLEQTKFQSRGEWRPKRSGIDTIRYWFGHSDYAHNELAGIDEIGSRFTNRSTEARLEVQHTPVATVLGQLTGAVGFQSVRENLRGQSFEGDSLLEPARTRSLAAYLFEELQLTSKLRMQGAVRYEESNVRGTGLDVTDPMAPLDVAGDRTFRPMSGSIGALYDLPAGIVLRLTGQYTERAPVAAELYSRGLHEATETFEIGNPFLTIEKGKTIELGLRRAHGSFRFDASLYHTRFDGFIFKRLTGLGCGETYLDCESAGGTGDELKELRFSQRDATFTGAELIGQLDVAHLWRGVWGVEAQYDFVDARFSDGEYVPRIPPHRLGGGLYYRDRNVFAKVGLLHAFEQTNIASGETPTSGYTLLNAELSYTSTKSDPNLGPQFTIGIKGDNLLNDDVRNSVSFKKDEVLLPGASIRLFASIKLQ